MRPAGRGPLDSLYFDYPRFEPRRVPELAGNGARARVAIVGAGPIGMTAALTLARHGVESVLLDNKSTFNDGSRAICIARQSMNILRQIGAVAPFEKHALGWTHGTSYYRGHDILRFSMPHNDNERYLPMYNLQQQYTEKYLHDAVAREPLIDMRWCSEVIGIEQRQDGATLAVSTSLGRYALAADYVLAADGARSPLRSMLGLRLKGENYEGNYVIADVRMQHDYPTERRAFFEPAGNPGGTVLVHKQPDDIWRIDYQLKEGESAEEAVREENIRARVEAILRDIDHRGPWDLEWWSIYTANTLCLDDYRHGRLFFIGDSAHIVPIFGVRGLNNGLADAHNIGWKLAYVLNGHAAPALLDSYSPERRGATLDVFANAGKSARFMTPPTRGTKIAREAALSLAIRHPFAGELANPRQMQPYTYADSPITLLRRPRCRVFGGSKMRKCCHQRAARRRRLSARPCRRRLHGIAVLRRRAGRRHGHPRCRAAPARSRFQGDRHRARRPERRPGPTSPIPTRRWPEPTAQAPLRSTCCALICTLPAAGAQPSPTRSSTRCPPAWEENHDDRHAVRGLRERLRATGRRHRSRRAH